MAMQKRTEFPRVVAASTAVMLVSYVGMGALGYAALGPAFNHSLPITSVLPADMWSRLANVGLFAHCILAYMVCTCVGSGFFTVV